jgi:thiol-disulfide isomerase/thioredoxin
MVVKSESSRMTSRGKSLEIYNRYRTRHLEYQHMHHTCTSLFYFDLHICGYFHHHCQSSKPLFEQLEEEKDKKQAQYDAMTKMMFAPTKALDEEEAEHFNAVEDRKRNDRILLKMQEDSELDSFKYERLSKTVSVDEKKKGDDIHSTLAPPMKHKKEPAVSTKIKAKKRKVDKAEEDVNIKEEPKINKQAEEPSSSNPLSLLGGYDSDSE